MPLNASTQPTAGPAMPLTIPLENLGPDQRLLAGGKAVNLGILLRAKLPVPPGFCVTVEAFNHFIAACPKRPHLLEILSHLQKESPENMARLSEEIAGWLMATTIPPQVEQAIITAWNKQGEDRTCVVRSSSTVEDTLEHSFAGQYESFLNLRGRAALLAAVRKCWLSLYSARALAYYARFSLPTHQQAMAVIVQEMIPATAAGVLFTLDPASEKPGRIRIEAAAGLGDGVVRGQVAPEVIVLEKASMHVLQRTTALQTETAAVLGDSTARQLGFLSLKAEQVLKGPLDIEWAMDANGLHLLQARPITVKKRLKSLEERQIWTNANAGEALPDVVTPMTYSVLMPFLQGLCDNSLCHLGFRIEASHLVTRIAGRAYFNVNLSLALLKLLPGTTPNEVGAIFGGAQEHAGWRQKIQLDSEDVPKLRFHPWFVVRRLPGVLVMMVRFCLLKNPLSNVTPPAACLPQGSKTIAHYSNDELLGGLHAALPSQEMGEHPALRYMCIGAFWLVALHVLSKRLFGAEGPAIAGRLTTGLGTLNPAEAGRDLWRLAEFASLHPELRRAVEEETDFPQLQRRIQPTEAGKEFLERWNAFLERHGHHAQGEVELLNPRWRETPNRVLDFVKNYLAAIADHHPTPPTNLGNLELQRTTQEKECLRRLKNPLKRWAFERILRWAQRGVAIKENVKSECVRHVSRVRALLLELGRRLVEQGHCDDPTDVFFLTAEELRADMLFAPGMELRKTVARRRAEYAQNQKLHPPPVVFGNGDPGQWQMEAIGPAANHLEGLAASPGMATGRARVLINPNSGERVLPGEILVAPNTDPAWSPYFLTAAGVVIDLGGMLSHGSILAREYGLPAVTNAGSATRTIHTGDLVQVDGNRGQVHILERISPK